VFHSPDWRMVPSEPTIVRVLGVPLTAVGSSANTVTEVQLMKALLFMTLSLECKEPGDRNDLLPVVCVGDFQM
jgi:hypothetical protein